MPFDKIPETRRTKTFAKDIIGEDEVDSSVFRLATDKRSANIAQHLDALKLPEIVPDSGEIDDLEAVSHHFLKELVEDKYRAAFPQLDNTPIENEDLSKPNDIDHQAQGSETKEKEKAYSYTYCEMFWSIVAIGSYVVDIGSDVFIAYMYFVGGKHWWWFGLTVGFSLVSSLTITVVSLTWYRQDHLSEGKEYKASRGEWICRIVLHVLQLGPVVRYADTIRYGLKSRRAEKSNSLKERNYWHIEKAFEDTDATLLRLFECYLEAAPQLTLQLYIIMSEGFSDTIYFAIGQVVSCASSLTSIAWALTSYHAVLRYSLNKANMSSGAVIIMLLWRLCSVSARVLAFALFASLFKFWIFVVIWFHVFMVFLWVLCQETSFCGSSVSEVLFGAVVALLNTYDYFNFTDGHTRLRYLLFYILIFVENLAMTLTIFLVDPSTTLTTSPDVVALTTSPDVVRSTASFLYPVMASILTLHLVAIAIQVTYYLRFHPNNNSRDGGSRIQRCISCRVLLGKCCSRPEQSCSGPEQSDIKRVDL